MDDKKQKRKLNVDFTNAFIVLMGVALLSIVIYAVILRISGVDSSDTSTNQLNGQIEEPQKETLITGNGYIVYKIGSQYYLQVLDGSKVDDINALISSLELPSTTEVINPAAAYPRPIQPSQGPIENDHLDDNFDPINPNPTQPEPNPNE